MIEAVANHQIKDKNLCSHGSWIADDRWGYGGGRLYATAINVLTLEVYYRYDSAFAPLASTTERKTARKKSPRSPK